MNDMITSNYMTGVCSNLLKKYETGNGRTGTAAFRDQAAEKIRESRIAGESVVARYKEKHPKEASVVDAQVRAGKDVRAKNGVADVSTEDMTMEEYKNFISGLLNSIPFDRTRIYDQEMISISDAGWEQMKKDPDYEAWVLGYTVQNRSVRNPFFGWPGASGSFYVEKFGASIEEHHGQSVGTTGPGSKSSKNRRKEKSWWDERHERMKQFLEEEIKAAQKRKQEQKELENSYSDSEIVVKPDGSRVLVITTNIGGMQSTMSLKISEPTEMPNEVAQVEEESGQQSRVTGVAKQMPQMAQMSQAVSAYEANFQMAGQS